MGSTKFMDTEEALAHFGVLGMKWGHRKVLAEAPRAAGYNYYQQNNDRLNYGNAGGDRINARINKGMDRISAQKAETTYRRRRALLIAGGAYAALLIAKHGPSIFQGIANSYVGKKATEAGAKAAAEAFSNTHGITNHKIVDLGYNAVTGVWG